MIPISVAQKDGSMGPQYDSSQISIWKIFIFLKNRDIGRCFQQFSNCYGDTDKFNFGLCLVMVLFRQADKLSWECS